MSHNDQNSIIVNSSQAVALQGKQHSSAKSFSPGAIDNHYDDDDHDDGDDDDDDHHHHHHQHDQAWSCIVLFSTEPSHLLRGLPMGLLSGAKIHST